MADDPLACPDFLAERRYAYGKAAEDDGHWRAAADMFEQALERAPDWPPAAFALGEAREKLGDEDGAAAAFRAAQTADPSDSLGASARLALLEGARPDALPAAYVARLFDGYAPRFDAHLKEALAYRGPALIAAALDEASRAAVVRNAVVDRVGCPQRGRRQFTSALDIGCGTGLMGEVIRDKVGQLTGIDLSPRMVAEARARSVYDDLVVSEALAFLQSSASGAFDLILAADAFCYFGDLTQLFTACRRALRKAGLLAFSVEAFEGEGFRLKTTMRFAHAPAYVETGARGAGLEPLVMKAASTRREAGSDAPGLVCVLAP